MKFPFPFGPSPRSPRSSMASSEAIAGPSQQFAPNPARGIGTLPTPPRTLLGGLGQVHASNGRQVLTTHMVQPREGLDTATAHEPALADSYGSLYDTFDNRRRAPAPSAWGQAAGFPKAYERQPGSNLLDGLVPDPRSYDAMAAGRALTSGLDPTSEEYARLLTGRSAGPVSAKGQAPAGNPADIYPVPEELTAQALSLNDPIGADLSGLAPPQVPQFDDAVANPTAGDFVPTANGDYPVPASLDNPFPEERPSLSRGDIYPEPMSQEPSLDPNGYLSRSSGDNVNPSGYDLLREEFQSGIYNKHMRDRLREQQWNQDNRDATFGGLMQGVNTLASGFAPSRRQPGSKKKTADTGARDFADNQNDMYFKAAQNARLRRVSEMQDQGQEDQFYGKLLDKNDPGSPENRAKMANAYAALQNARTALQNANNKDDALTAKQEYQKNSLELRQMLEDGRNQRAQDANDIKKMLADLKKQEIQIKGKDTVSKIEERTTKAQETARHNKAAEQNVANGQAVSRENNIRTTATSRDNSIRGMQSRADKIQLDATKRNKDGGFIYGPAARRAAGLTLSAQNPNQRAMLIEYMKRANGDKAKAQALAEQDGYVF